MGNDEAVAEYVEAHRLCEAHSRSQADQWRSTAVHAERLRERLGVSPAELERVITAALERDLRKRVEAAVTR